MGHPKLPIKPNLNSIDAQGLRDFEQVTSQKLEMQYKIMWQGGDNHNLHGDRVVLMHSMIQATITSKRDYWDLTFQLDPRLHT